MWYRVCEQSARVTVVASIFQREQLRTSLLDCPTARTCRTNGARYREAWTDIGDGGAERRMDLGKRDKISQILPHPGLDLALGDAGAGPLRAPSASG